MRKTNSLGEDKKEQQKMGDNQDEHEVLEEYIEHEFEVEI